MKKFCIIPAFNEEKNIRKVIKDVKRYVDVVVVVDDGSKDKTFEIAKNENVIALKHSINRGQGAALQTGNQYAINEKADLVIHYDADGQFLANEIPLLIEPIMNKNADIVFGSRFLNIKTDFPWFKKTVIMPIGKLFNRIVLGVNLSDPQIGFRAMNYTALNKIKIQNDGMAHCSEIQEKAHRYKMRISEVGVTVIYNESGQGIFSGRGRGSGGIRIVKDILLNKLIN